jgi:hypothetical protein
MLRTWIVPGAFLSSRKNRNQGNSQGRTKGLFPGDPGEPPLAWQTRVLLTKERRDV